MVELVEAKLGIAAIIRLVIQDVRVDNNAVERQIGIGPEHIGKCFVGRQL